MESNKLITGGSNVMRKGFLSRMFKFIDDNLGFIGYVHSICQIGGAIVDGINDTFGTNWKINIDDTITNSEAIILENWDLKEFTPFFAKIIASLENVYKQSLSQNDRVKFANEILLKINAAENYYLNEIKQGLSANAIKLRIVYVTDVLGTVKTYFEQDLVLSGYEKIAISQDSTSLDLTPLVLNTVVNFDAELYKTSNDIQELTPSVVLATSNVPTTTIGTTVNGEPIVLPNNTTKTNILKIIAFIGLSALALKYAFSSEKE